MTAGTVHPPPCARNLPLSLSLVLVLAGCGGGGQTSDTETEGGVTIAVTLGATEGGSETETESASGSATEGGEPDCEVKDDCAAGFTCEEGRCVFDPDDCGEAEFNFSIEPPNVMLVLDKSGSMVVFKWDHDDDGGTPDVTRWFSLYSVVEFIVTEFNNSMNLGMVLYPSLNAQLAYDPVACLVEDTPEVPLAPVNGQAILMTLPPANATDAIAGGTPTRLGMETAVAHLLAAQDGLSKYIIMVTDGAANCAPEAETNTDLFEKYDHALTQTVADAYAAGISTFVVGIDMVNAQIGVGGSPESEQINPYQELNKLADAGGVPKDDPNERFYNAQNEIELQAALEAIVADLLPCTLDLDPIPDFPHLVEVTINGVEYGNKEVMDCATEDGWQYVDDSASAIRLCGQACADFQGTGSLDADYKCSSVG